MEPEKIVRNDSYFIFVLSDFSIAKTIGVSYSFSTNVRMMYVILAGHYAFQVL